jgi:cytochrome P450
MEKQASMQEEDRRKDLFYFLASARDPDTGAPVYQEFELRAEASLLIVAGSDTTSISLSGIFFYLTTNPHCLAKLTAEVRSAFSSIEDIVYGPRLLGCEYLKACVDEGMRLVPAGPCELPREVLAGGLLVRGEYYPPGTVVGTVPWALSRSRAVWGDDAGTFRPERWIVGDEEKKDGQHGSTKESAKRAREAHHPFLSGPGSCVGKNVAMVEMLIVIARTVYRFDIRRAPGSTVGGGGPGQGYGPDDPAEDPKQFQLYDAYISLRKGPVVQFRTRRV